MKINLNDCITVRLSPWGEEQWQKDWFPPYQEVPDKIREAATLPDGRVRFQLHEAMRIFGRDLTIGTNRLPFVDNAIHLSCAEEVKTVLDRESATTARYDAKLDAAAFSQEKVAALLLAATQLAGKHIFFDEAAAPESTVGSAFCGICFIHSLGGHPIQHLAGCLIGRVFGLIGEVMHSAPPVPGPPLSFEKFPMADLLRGDTPAPAGERHVEYDPERHVEYDPVEHPTATELA